MTPRTLIGSTLAALALLVVALDAPPAEAKLKCKNVGKRFQICGDGKPFKSLSVGVGIRFSKKKPGLAANPPAPKPTAPRKKSYAQ